jgi:hypothetical protein
VLGEPRETFTAKGPRQRLEPLRARKGAPKPKREFGTPVAPDFKYRLILVDTLGPDAIPGSLSGRITREAVKGYFDRLEGDGVVLIHISNRYFDLRPALANIAESLGVAGYQFEDDDEDGGVGKARSHWAAMTRKSEYLAKVLAAPRWARDEEQQALLGVALWPAWGSPAAQAMAGLAHAGQSWADFQAQRAHREEGRPGNPRLVRSAWEPLGTTAQLRRVQAEAPKEIRGLTARIEALKKQLGESREDTRKAWLAARIASLEEARGKLERQLRGAAEKIRRNAEVGVWTDASADLLSVFVR